MKAAEITNQLPYPITFNVVASQLLQDFWWKNSWRKSSTEDGIEFLEVWVIMSKLVYFVRHSKMFY